MTALQICLLIFVICVIIGVTSLGFAMLKFFICQEVGEFTVNLNPEDDVEALYNMNVYSHPSTWKGKKYVRFKVHYKS